MPQNDSHIVEVETWWCTPRKTNHSSKSSSNERSKKSTNKFQSTSIGRKVGILSQPPMQLKFLSNHRNIIVEWGDLKDKSSNIKPTLVKLQNVQNEKWTLKGRFIMKHDHLSHIKLHETEPPKLELFVSKMPVFRWGEQTWNKKLNRNNRTTWEMVTPTSKDISRWPLQFDAVENCISISIIPKQKHIKKLFFLVNKLLNNEERLGTPTANFSTYLPRGGNATASTNKRAKATGIKKRAASSRGTAGKKSSVKANGNTGYYDNDNGINIDTGAYDNNPLLHLYDDEIELGNDNLDNVSDHVLNDDLIDMLPKLAPASPSLFATNKRKQYYTPNGDAKLQKKRAKLSSPKLNLSDRLSLSPLSSTRSPASPLVTSGMVEGINLDKKYIKSPRTKTKSNNRSLFMTKKQSKARYAEPSLSQLGLTKKEYESIKSKNIHELLSNMVEDASHMASKDWAGSGSSEQVAILIDFFKALEQPFQAVVRIGIEKGTAFVRCHQLLLTIAGEWNRLKSVPIPGGVVNTLLQQRKVYISLDFTKYMSPLGGIDAGTSSNKYDGSNNGIIMHTSRNRKNSNSKNNNSNNKKQKEERIGKIATFNRIIFSASDGHVDFTLKEIWGMLLISAANSVNQYGAVEVSDDTMYKFIKDVIDYCGHNTIFDTGELRHSRLGNLFKQRDKWEYLPTLHKGFSFDSPRGGPLMTLDDANGGGDMTNYEKGTKLLNVKRPHGTRNVQRFAKTPPHFRLNPSLQNSRLRVHRSDSWDNFLGADDSPYK
jgi:hypothetical protein